MKIEQGRSLPLLLPSFAYNHSLVVQPLATPKPKHTTMNNIKGPNRNLRKGSQQQHFRKQVRRRLHTSRPYQERLLNMAEARREIVTALKYHRAAMRQASEEQQQPQSLPLKTSHVSSFDQDGVFKSRKNPRMHPSCTTKISNYIDGFSYSSSYPSLNSHRDTSHVTSPIFAHPPPPSFTLPNQALGLNLNLHHINRLQAPLFLKNNNNRTNNNNKNNNNNSNKNTNNNNNNNNNKNNSSSKNNNNNNDKTNSPLCSYSSPTSSSPPPVTNQDVPSFVTSNSQGEGVSSTVSNATIHFPRGLHMEMDDEGMAEIRSLGEQHQMEWDDTMSLVTSVWWFNCLKNMDHCATHEVKTEDGASQIFDELNEFPSWLNNDANERCLELYSEDYFHDPTSHCL